MNISRSRNRSLSLVTLAEIPPVAGIMPPPAGYGLFQARKWGDPILVAQAGLSTAPEYFNTSNFQVVPCYVPETGTFSATAGNHAYYDRALGDLDQIWNLQPKDGRTMERMFNPIVSSGNYGTTFWTNSELGWAAAPHWVAGTQLYGGQLFAATLQTYSILCQLPGQPKAYVTCRKVYPFRREHFVLTWEHYPWLINKYTVAFQKPVQNTYSETFDGLIRFLPMQVLEPQHFKFTGNIRPSAFYTPSAWSIPIQ